MSAAIDAARRRPNLRRLLLLLLGPLALLVAADRALVLWPAHWAWVARDLPPRVYDPYRIEAQLRATPPGRQNVPVLGNSIAERGIDEALLDERFASEGLHFPKLTLAGSAALTFGFLANAVANLEPRAAIFVPSGPALSSNLELDRVHAYDVRAVGELFSVAEILDSAGFHAGGFAGELHVFARHRRALLRAALVRLGLRPWKRDPTEAELTQARERGPGDENWRAWLRAPIPDRYPNANTRALVRLGRVLRERGSRLILLDAPLHPAALLADSEGRIDAYRKQLHELAAAEGLELLAPEQLVELSPQDFADWVHLAPAGSERLSAALADALETRVAERP